MSKKNGKGGNIIYNDLEAANKLSEETVKAKKKKNVLNILNEKKLHSQHENLKDSIGGQSSKKDLEDRNTDTSDSDMEAVDETASVGSKDTDTDPSVTKKTSGGQKERMRASVKESRLSTAVHGPPNSSHLSNPQMDIGDKKERSLMQSSVKPRPLPTLPPHAKSSDDRTDRSSGRETIASADNKKKGKSVSATSSKPNVKKNNESKKFASSLPRATEIKTTEFTIDAADKGAYSETSKNQGGNTTPSAAVRGLQDKAATVYSRDKPKNEVTDKNKGKYVNSNTAVHNGASSSRRNGTKSKDRTDTKKQADPEKESSTRKESNGDIYPMNVQSCSTEISGLDVDVIVSSEDGSLKGQGMVATHLEKKGGETFKRMKLWTLELCTDKMLPPWQFTSSPSLGKLKCRNVFHAHVLSIQHEKDQDEWCRMLQKLFQNLFVRADAMGFTSIAVPLLGTGRNGTPIAFVIDLLGEVILNFMLNTTDRRFLKDIFIVHPDSKTASEIDRKIQKLAKENGLDERSFRSRKSENQKTTLKEEKTITKKKSSSKESDEVCPICMDTIDSSKRKELDLCHHVFCRDCIDHCFKVSKPMCPTCNTVYGVITGNQPKGYMMEAFQKEYLPGFKCGAICIMYLFDDGIQKDDHPHKGKQYKGTKRSAYLPDNADGQKVHRLLRKAFEQRLTFTIGSSRTTGKDDVVTWNDIHHKTRRDGGTARYGYPDPGYIERVLDELKAKGIVED